MHGGKWALATAMVATMAGGCKKDVGGFDPGAEGGEGGSESGTDSAPGGGGELACDQGSPGPRMLRLLTRREYAATVADLLGVEPPPTDLIPIESTIAHYDNDASAVVTARHVDAYMEIAADVAEQAVEQAGPMLVGCMPADPECPRLFIEELGARAMRRPMAGDEVDLYLELFDPAATDGDFYEGVRLVIRGLLMSPQFLYRSELGEPTGADGQYRLTPYEVASALSYGLWGTMPDPELLDAAASGELDDPDGIELQARRLLDHPRGRTQTGEFFIQWLGTAPLLHANKDAEIYPDFSSEIREAMAAEQQAFVEHVIYDGDATIEELLRADYVFVDDALAGFYGLPAPGSSTPVSVPAGPERGGLLTLGSVLASHAHPNESSPVRRGLFVRERLLCQIPPPPPPDVNTVPPELDPTATTRERFGQHSVDPACSGCHRLIDPLGFGFESYDGVGAFRSTENDLPIDASGEIVEIEQGAAPIPFDGLEELATQLSQSPVTSACIVENYVHFTAGRPVTEQDECTIETLSDQLAENGGDLHEMFIDRVRLDAFVIRTE
ncbi:MAG: DUF1592 domain-containing protein [Myxococcota bacterium]